VTKGRMCQVCGRRLYKGRSVAHEFPLILKELELDGMWAHSECIAKLIKYRQAQRRLAGKDDHD
jgi:hypothetical protein